MEEEKTLKITHVADLLNMKFNIPSYQRGYRWEKKHVEALLDDLYSFTVQINETLNRQGKFYCIQPLAVVENKELSSDAGIVYDVIDGQQRLTTIYLLLSYLEDERRSIYTGNLATSIFTLKYESRDSDFFENKEFKKCKDISEAINNIDFFYMTRAYRTIDSWFETKGISQSVILKVLIPENHRDISQLLGDELENAQTENDKNNDVRFIWYHVPTKKNVDSIEVFSQLNYGKTPLTATELVKALLFQCDLYTEDTELMREIAFRRSCEWDAMEKQLQDSFMWAMLMPEDYQPTSHITILLSLVCNELFKELEQRKPQEASKLQKDDDDFNYQVCNLYLGTNKDGKYADNVKRIWERIQSTYTALFNWYKDSNTYHLIGLLVWLKEFKKSDFSENKRFELVQQLMEVYNKKSKKQFTDLLIKKIATLIHIEENKSTKDGKTIPWGLERINYNDNPEAIIKILVTFNVDEMRKQQDESSRFPFHLLRKYNITSLEHIHPQNLNLDNIKLDTLRTWLDVKEMNLKQLNKYNNYVDSIKTLREYIKDENTYKDNKNIAQDIINKIDKEFDDLANMDESQMHTLYNMALVDKNTNSALSNKLLDEKRGVLIEFHATGKTYVLPSTHKVFSKHYSKVTQDNVLPKLWTQPDRLAYFQNIKSIYLNYMEHYND